VGSSTLELLRVPKPAIEAFLDIFARSPRYPPRVEVIETGWQIWVRKTFDQEIAYFD
jgi:hypothetical protein